MKIASLVKQTWIPIIILVLISLPFWAGDYILHVSVITFITIIYCSTWRQNLISGDFSFGHNAWIGIGAYAAALLGLNLGLSFWVSLPLGGIAALIVAVIFGYATLRVRGMYWSVLSWAFGEVMVAIYTRFMVPFGGAGGLSSIPRPTVPFFPEFVDSKIFWYFLVLVLMLVILLALYALEKSRFGRTLTLIAENDSLARSLGVNVLNYKVVNLAISSFFAAIAGGIFAYYVTAISPLVFNVLLVFLIVIYAAVGGRNHFMGPIIGVTVLMVLTQGLLETGAIRSMLLGGILIVCQLFLPEGLVSLPKTIKGWFDKRKSKGVADASSA